VENWLWKRLRTCRKTDCRMNEFARVLSSFSARIQADNSDNHSVKSGQPINLFHGCAVSGNQPKEWIQQSQHEGSLKSRIKMLFQIWHSEDRASWYVLIMKANEMHYSSYLFDKVLYIFLTGPLSIIGSISTLYTCNRHLTC